MGQDLTLTWLALLPVLWRAGQLGMLSTSLAPTPAVASLEWALATLSIAALYMLHAFIWNFPGPFSRACSALPLKLLGRSAVDVFASLEIIGKVWQASVLLLFIGAEGRSAVAVAVLDQPVWVYATSIALIAAGQTLNFAMYKAIGNAGVYYGFLLGFTVPWCYGFPFNVGLRHPQYVGVVLSIWGGLLLVLSEETADLGLSQLCIAWALMYVAMSAMEQSGDQKVSD